MTDQIAMDMVHARPALSMDAYNGLLLDGVPLSPIAAALGTPTWVYGADTIRARYDTLATALGPGVHLHYAVKANDHLAVLRILGGLGAGMDVVSGGELARALAAGVPAARIVFSGVGKSRADIEAALAAGIGQINVESAEELAHLSAIADTTGRTATLTLRVNPDVDAGTHAKITTGRLGDKFGIPAADIPSLYAHGVTLPGIAMAGLAVHIGSQVASAKPYRRAYAVLAGLVAALRAAGHTVTRVDGGGGLGIAYRDEPALSPAVWAGALHTAFGGLGVQVMVEPGRWLVGPAGVLLTRVILSRVSAGRRFVVLDAAMNDLLRPAMYDAWHGIVPLSPIDARAAHTPATIVGPVCESSDLFARDRDLPHLADGALVAILDAGAYGAVMSSTYNARPLAAQALIDRGRWHMIRARQPVEALWAGDIVPDGV